MSSAFDPGLDAARWRAASSQLVAVATVVDNRLIDGAVPPLHLAGGFVRATATVTERCENVLVRVGQHPGELPGDVSDEILAAMRLAVRHLRAARAALGDVAAALDPDGRGIY
jgi:hypothetical protein